MERNRSINICWLPHYLCLCQVSEPIRSEGASQDRNVSNTLTPSTVNENFLDQKMITEFLFCV